MKIKRPSLRITMTVLFLSLALVSIQMGCVGVDRQAQSEPLAVEVTVNEYVQYLPYISRSHALPPLELVAAETRNTDNLAQNIFFIWDTVVYTSRGMNNTNGPIQANLSWNLDGPCDTGQVYNQTLVLPPGSWEHTYAAITPGCNGAFTATFELDYQGDISTLDATYLVVLEQAFDRCSLPTVSQMQTWWNASPYTVWNMYLGGIHFPCSLTNLTPSWVDSVSNQGWDFILTWVGPQAPCSDFYYRFSSNWLTAYWQGVDEAQAAIAKARSLGINQDLIIYYDLEAYIVPDGDTTCRYAAAKFIQGWTEELHTQGALGGGYGSPCNSYIKDWYNYNATPPDDVWIAHWLLPAQYRPDASVWNVACMDNTYWPNHQRIRQYAGDHTETWGGVAFTIDSSVVDGDTVTLPTAQSVNLPSVDRLADSITQEFSTLPTPDIQKVELVTGGVGLALTSDGLLRTDDGGRSWQEITPEIPGGIALESTFLDEASGWVVMESGLDGSEIRVYRSFDGGETWTASDLLVARGAIARAYLDFVDRQTGWLVLKLESGSSFSLGRLYATRDGGRTWEERSAPLGEPAVFVNEVRGWMVGGPAGDGFYRTLDGGLTWEPQELPGLPQVPVFIGQPQFTTPQEGRIPVTLLADPDASLVIYVTRDGGDTWFMEREVALTPGSQPGDAVPFNLQTEVWHLADPSISGLTVFDKGKDAGAPTTLGTTGLPPGTVSLDFISPDLGWALVQENRCSGDKIQTYQPDPVLFTCEMKTRLFRTDDGGLTWLELNPLD